MAKKPSFFERLTGASWNENEPLEDTAPLKKIKKGSKAKKAYPVKADPEIGKEKKIATPKKPEAPAIQEESWLTESEGQLTIDVYQTPNEIVIKSTIAGVKPEDIDITMSNDMITIKGTRRKDEDIKEEDYYYQECYWGPFSRSVILPVDVEVDQADAAMKNGILTIRLPKIERVKTKKIRIKTE